MEERYKSMIVVDLMLTRKNGNDKEILLALRKNTGYKDGEYELPGGHVEADEDLMKAMVREAKEELNIDIKEDDMKIEHILHHYRGNRLKFIISAEKYEGDLQIGEPDKCEKIEWFSLNNLPDNLDKRVKGALKEIKSGVLYDNSDFVNLDK